MALYRRGSHGDEVNRIQRCLRELGHYQGPIDGDFGGGTEAAVRAFQKSKRLKADGVVGTKTWAALFSREQAPEPSIAQQSLAYRCLALTGAFETSTPPPECFAGLSGDFDGQGISFGALQWNLGQGSLQPLLRAVDGDEGGIVKDIFGTHYQELREMLGASRDEQMEWARSIQDAQRHRVFDPWRGLFKALGRRRECQDVQVSYAQELYEAALALCKEYRVQSERAVALMFDIKVQNGSIRSVARAQIEGDFERLRSFPSWEAREVARLDIIANRRAEASNPRWVEDVRTRKLAIARGEGTVHGRPYVLEDQYGIRIRKVKVG